MKYLSHLKFLLKKSPIYELYLFFPSQKRKEIKKVLDEQREYITSLKRPLIVLNGPFKGMKYLNESFCSTLSPKIRGTYEEEIQDWFELTENDFSIIADIGSAEGYYAVGLARKFPNKTVYAYDIDRKARELCKKLCELNSIKNLKIKKECNHKELNLLPERSLIICDIEGFEKTLLDPKKANLKNKSIILEAHEVFEPRIVQRVIKRFKNTHNIEIRYNNLQKKATLEEELRKGFTPWIRLMPKKNTFHSF